MAKKPEPVSRKSAGTAPSDGKKPTAADLRTRDGREPDNSDGLDEDGKLLKPYSAAAGTDPSDRDAARARDATMESKHDPRNVGQVETTSGKKG